MEGETIDLNFPQIPQFFKTLKPDSPSFSSKFKPLVSDVSILEVRDDHSSFKPRKSNKNKNVSVTTNNSVVELLDDDDCVFVKIEKKVSMSKGNHKKDPIYVEEKLGKKVAVDVDDYDDEISIIHVRPSPSLSSSSSLFSSRKKRKSSFSGISITEVGESSTSRSKAVAKDADADADADDDEVVVEIEPPPEMMFMCEICADSKPKKESFKIQGCTDSYCSECMKNYVASKLQDGVSQINCPVPTCTGVLEPEYCRDILPLEVFVRWGNLLCESVILASQKFYCPFKDCSALLVDDGSEKVTRSECPSCYRLFCAQCKVGWHEGVACAEYQALSKDERGKEDIMLRKLAKSKNWQRCPKCKYYVEKSDGCLYMKCRCGVAFCYSCGGIHTDHRYHYCKKCRR